MTLRRKLASMSIGGIAYLRYGCQLHKNEMHSLVTLDWAEIKIAEVCC